MIEDEIILNSCHTAMEITEEYLLKHENVLKAIIEASTQELKHHLEHEINKPGIYKLTLTLSKIFPKSK